MFLGCRITVHWMKSSFDVELLFLRCGFTVTRMCFFFPEMFQLVNEIFERTISFGSTLPLTNMVKSATGCFYFLLYFVKKKNCSSCTLLFSLILSSYLFSFLLCLLCTMLVLLFLIIQFTKTTKVMLNWLRCVKKICECTYSCEGMYAHIFLKTYLACWLDRNISRLFYYCCRFVAVFITIFSEGYLAI